MWEGPGEEVSDVIRNYCRKYTHYHCLQVVYQRLILDLLPCVHRDAVLELVVRLAQFIPWFVTITYHCNRSCLVLTGGLGTRQARYAWWYTAPRRGSYNYMYECLRSRMAKRFVIASFLLLGKLTVVTL